MKKKTILSEKKPSKREANRESNLAQGLGFFFRIDVLIGNPTNIASVHLVLVVPTPGQLC